MEELKSEMVEFIIIHHSNRFFDCPLFVKLRHKFIRGWDDTGYHFIIGNGILSRNGKVYETRSVKKIGAHAYGYNKKSIGICLVGNFDSKIPSFKQYRSLINLISKLKNEFEIKNILGHNETEGCLKSCPGNSFPIRKLNLYFKTS